MPTNGQARDPAARITAFISVAISVVALGVSAFAAYQSFRSAKAAIAGARPIVEISVPDPVTVQDTLRLPIVLTNIGKSSAAIKAVQIVQLETPDSAGGSRCWYKEIGDLENSILRPGASATRVIVIPRYSNINGVSIDISKGVDDKRRLRFKIAYDGLELDETFESDTAIPVRWND